jgi:hypothetical protein
MREVVDLAGHDFVRGALVSKARLRLHEPRLKLRMLARQGQQRFDQNREFVPKSADILQTLDHLDDPIAHALVLLADGAEHIVAGRLVFLALLREPGQQRSGSRVAPKPFGEQARPFGNDLAHEGRPGDFHTRL